MFKQAASSNGLLALLILDKEELNDTERLNAYKEATMHIQGVQKISKDLKK